MSKKNFKSYNKSGSGLSDEKRQCVQALSVIFPDWEEQDVKEFCIKYNWKLAAVQEAIADKIDYDKPENEWQAVDKVPAKKTSAPQTKPSSRGAPAFGAPKGEKGAKREFVKDGKDSKDAKDGEKKPYEKRERGERGEYKKDGEKKTYEKRERPKKDEEEKKKKAEPAKPITTWAQIASRATPVTAAAAIASFSAPVEEVVVIKAEPAYVEETSTEEPVAMKTRGVWSLNKASGAQVVSGTAGPLIKPEPAAPVSWTTTEEEPTEVEVAIITEPTEEVNFVVPVVEEVFVETVVAPEPVVAQPTVQRVAPVLVISKTVATTFGSYSFGAPALQPEPEVVAEVAPVPVAAPVAAPAPAPVMPEPVAEPVVEQMPKEEEYYAPEPEEYIPYDDQQMMYGMYNQYGDYRHHRGGSRPHRQPSQRQPPKPQASAMPQYGNYYAASPMGKADGDDRKRAASGKHSPVAAAQQQQFVGNEMYLQNKKAQPYGGYKAPYNKQYPQQMPPPMGGNPKAKGQMPPYGYMPNYYPQYPMYGGYQQQYYGRGNPYWNYPYEAPFPAQTQDEEYAQGQTQEAVQGEYEWDKEKKDRRANNGFDMQYAYNYQLPQQQAQQQQQYRGY